MKEFKGGWVIEKKQENYSQSNSNYIDIVAPTPTEGWVADEPPGYKLVSIACNLFAFDSCYSPIIGPNVAIGAFVKKMKDNTIGLYLFGTSSPTATLKLSCTVSPSP
jgi:hypothetical protein